ncbi:MAG TPA: hypothetical protein VFG51_03965 [Candidatus Saccharimonadia bacterium]|nr:hypothetical protein [Candidatus Saccharimonadia bacterium]
MSSLDSLQLRPGNTIQLPFSIANTTGTEAMAAIELDQLTESRTAISSYIDVVIREDADEPKIVFGPAALSDLYVHGFTELSVIAPHAQKKYIAQLKIQEDIPQTFQQERIRFDLKVGTGNLSQSSPAPSPISIFISTQQATPSATALVRTIPRKIAVTKPSPAVLGASTQATFIPTATAIPTSPLPPPTATSTPSLHQLQETVLLGAAVTIAFTTLAIITAFSLVRRHLRPQP